MVIKGAVTLNIEFNFEKRSLCRVEPYRVVEVVTKSDKHYTYYHINDTFIIPVVNSDDPNHISGPSVPSTI